jgi:2-C-methyl-D-erythritol 4-phosphate cytidylyltransferase
MACHVIIPAAGSGSRMGATLPKQYLSLNDQPLIMHCIKIFSESDAIANVHVVLSEGDAYWRDNIKKKKLHAKVNVLTCGGETRAQTVLNGLDAIADTVKDNDWVLVHDAARPGLTHGLLNTLMYDLQDDAVGGLLALPLADTLKRGDNRQVCATVPRNNLWQAQTPQMFRYGTLRKALTEYNGVPTDEAEAVEALGLAPTLVTGALRNLKVTYPQDLAVVTALMNAPIAAEVTTKKKKD